MKFSYLLAVLLTINIVAAAVRAKRVLLVPLSRNKIYDILQKTQSLAAIPEGRVVNQGIAVASDFSLELRKALRAAVLYYKTDVATSRQADGNASATNGLYATEEVCFSTRNARSFEEAQLIEQAYSRLMRKDQRKIQDYGEFRQSQVRQSNRKRKLQPKRYGNRKPHTKKSKKAQRIKVLKPNSNKYISSPISDAEAVNSNIKKVAAGTAQEISQNNGGLASTLSTTTSTDNDQNAITCIVIQKPKQ